MSGNIDKIREVLSGCETTAALLPCPFCGGEAILSYIPEWDYAKYKRYFICCANCGIGTRATESVGEDGICETISAWNRRAGQEVAV